MSGVTTCTPEYSVPGRTPQIWLTRTPARPSGTSTKPRETTSNPAAAPASCAARRHRTGPKGRAGKNVVAPVLPSSSLFRFSKRRSCEAIYTSYTTSAPALPNNAIPTITSSHFSATIAVLLPLRRNRLLGALLGVHLRDAAHGFASGRQCPRASANCGRTPAPPPECRAPAPSGAAWGLAPASSSEPRCRWRRPDRSNGTRPAETPKPVPRPLPPPAPSQTPKFRLQLSRPSLPPRSRVDTP